MATPTYEIVRYRPEFRDEVISIQTHLWSEDKALNDAYFAWKYEDNPLTDGVPIYLALSGGEVAGMRGMMAAEWRLGRSAETYRSLCACDLVVTPAHRGRGLVRKINEPALADLASRGHDLVLNMSASPINFLASLKLGWKLAGPYRSWRWQTRKLALSRGLHRWMRGKPGFWRFETRRIPLLEPERPSPLDRLAAHFATGAGGAAGLRFSEVPDTAAMAELAERLTPDDGRVRHTVSADFLDWRYRNPQSRYGFLYAGADPLRGYLSLHVKRGGDPEDVSIMDWQAEDPEALRGMISALQRSGAVESLAIWSATLDEEARATLSRLGFAGFDDTRGIAGFTPGILYMARDPDRAARSLGAAFGRFTDLAGWDLRMAYSDYY